MKPFDWNEEKNQKLKIERDISFEEVIDAIENDGLLAEIENPHKEKYKSQEQRGRFPLKKGNVPFVLKIF